MVGRNGPAVLYHDLVAARVLRSRLVPARFRRRRRWERTKESPSSLDFSFRDSRVHRSIAVGGVEAVVGVGGYGVAIALLKGAEWFSKHGQPVVPITAVCCEAPPIATHPRYAAKPFTPPVGGGTNLKIPAPRSKKPQTLVVTLIQRLLEPSIARAQWMHVASAAEDRDRRARSGLREGSTRVVAYPQIAVGIEGYFRRAVQPVPAEAKPKRRAARARQIASFVHSHPRKSRKLGGGPP